MKASEEISEEQSRQVRIRSVVFSAFVSSGPTLWHGVFLFLHFCPVYNITCFLIRFWICAAHTFFGSSVPFVPRPCVLGHMTCRLAASLSALTATVQSLLAVLFPSLSSSFRLRLQCGHQLIILCFLCSFCLTWTTRIRNSSEV